MTKYKTERRVRRSRLRNQSGQHKSWVVLWILWVSRGREIIDFQPSIGSLYNKESLSVVPSGARQVLGNWKMFLVHEGTPWTMRDAFSQLWSQLETVKSFLIGNPLGFFSFSFLGENIEEKTLFSWRIFPSTKWIEISTTSIHAGSIWCSGSHRWRCLPAFVLLLACFSAAAGSLSIQGISWTLCWRLKFTQNMCVINNWLPDPYFYLQNKMLWL